MCMNGSSCRLTRRKRWSVWGAFQYSVGNFRIRIWTPKIPTATRQSSSGCCISTKGKLQQAPLWNRMVVSKTSQLALRPRPKHIVPSVLPGENAANDRGHACRGREKVTRQRHQEKCASTLRPGISAFNRKNNMSSVT